MKQFITQQIVNSQTYLVYKIKFKFQWMIHQVWILKLFKRNNPKGTPPPPTQSANGLMIHQKYMNFLRYWLEIRVQTRFSASLDEKKNQKKEKLIFTVLTALDKRGGPDTLLSDIIAAHSS